MAKKLPGHTVIESGMTLDNALYGWRQWCQAPPELIRKLGGQSNSTYLVCSERRGGKSGGRRVAADKFVIRINHPAAHLGVDRFREKQILNQISGLDYAPEVVFWHKDFLVTRFIPRQIGDRSDATSPDPNQVGRLFTKIHQTAIALSDVFDPREHLNSYYTQIERPTAALTRCYEQVSELAQLYNDNRQCCLCHHDLLEGNIIIAEDNMKVIDWEYANLGNPVFDIAVYAETNRLDRHETLELLEACDGNVTTDQLQHYRLIYAMIELLWWQLRGTLPEDIPAKLTYLESQLKIL